MRRKKRNTNLHGFTLLETLISIGIIASVGILIAQVFFSTTRANTKTELLKDVKQNGQYAIEVMSRLIRSSINIETACSDTGSTLTSLDVKNPDGNVTTLGCVFDNEVTRIASTSATSPLTPQYLTSYNVNLGGSSCTDNAMTLSFLCTTYTDQAPKITVSFKLSQKGTPPDQFEKASVLFQTTVSPRF
jgi:type II secretory pathway pseudopilin PulG